MSTSGLNVTRVPPPLPVSRSQSGASPAPGSAGPSTSAATTATAPTFSVVRSTVGATELELSASHPGARSSSHARCIATNANTARRYSAHDTSR
jgi:hypothetical protein